jgi:hypothetical protein
LPQVLVNPASSPCRQVRQIAGNYPEGVTVMSKEKTRKKPQKTLKEKRREKKQKKQQDTA